MVLKFKFNSREEIPADLTNHCVERDGAFLLDLEGGVEKSRLDEMRANNLELRKQIEERREKSGTRWGGADVADGSDGSRGMRGGAARYRQRSGDEPSPPHQLA